MPGRRMRKAVRRIFPSRGDFFNNPDEGGFAKAIVEENIDLPTEERGNVAEAEPVRRRLMRRGV